jgi:hypothetical protein
MGNIVKITQLIENTTSYKILIAPISYILSPLFLAPVFVANFGFCHRKMLPRRQSRQDSRSRAITSGSTPSAEVIRAEVPHGKLQNLRYNRASLEGTMRNRPASMAAAFCLLLCFLAAAQLANAQSRMSDKDIEHMMKNLKADSKQFQSLFNPAIAKSTIRKTTQEKDAKALVKNFRNQAEGMLNTFQRQKRADATLPLIMDSAQRIDKLLADVPLNGSVTSQWAKVKTELGTLAEQFNLPGPGR